jgi:hypothetical protein
MNHENRKDPESLPRPVARVKKRRLKVYLGGVSIAPSAIAREKQKNRFDDSASRPVEAMVQTP